MTASSPSRASGCSPPWRASGRSCCSRWTRAWSWSRRCRRRSGQRQGRSRTPSSWTRTADARFPPTRRRRAGDQPRGRYRVLGGRREPLFVTLTENSMFTPFLTVLDVQLVPRGRACPCRTRMPTCMTVMNGPARQSYLAGQRDGGCASREAPSGARPAQSASNHGSRRRPSCTSSRRKCTATASPSARQDALCHAVEGAARAGWICLEHRLDGVLSAPTPRTVRASSATRRLVQRQGLNSFAYRRGTAASQRLA